MGWKMEKDRKKFDKDCTKPDPVTIFGVAVSGNPYQRAGGDLTRHHIIPHSLLIEVWNSAVDYLDFETIKALATWAGLDPGTALPATLDPGNANPNPSPQSVLRKVAWNPFNIVVGPLSEHRVEDPGDSFDGIQFTRLQPSTSAGKHKDWRENLARQEFNQHVMVLRRIYNYLTRYVAGKPIEQDHTSLCQLLRGDAKSRYPQLAKVVGGALLSPDLWADYSTTLEQAPDFKVTDTSKTPFTAVQTAHQRITRALLIPWSTVSYLPEVAPQPVKPDAIDPNVWAPGEANPPFDRLLLGKVEYKGEVEQIFRETVFRTARSLGKLKARVIFFGPRGEMTELANWTASEMTRLNRDGYSFRLSKTFFDHGEKQVRFYDFLSVAEPAKPATFPKPATKTAAARWTKQGGDWVKG